MGWSSTVIILLYFVLFLQQVFYNFVSNPSIQSERWRQIVQLVQIVRLNLANLFDIYLAIHQKRILKPTISDNRNVTEKNQLFNKIAPSIQLFIMHVSVY